jgi:hypothetical protein
MLISRQFCRVLSILGLALLAASPAAAQVSEPEFVPYVNDLQLFDQPDLSPYGRGVPAPQGWFGSAEFLNWSVSAPSKTQIGSPTPQLVYSPGAATFDTGTQAAITTTIFNTTNVAATLPNFTLTVNGQGIVGTLTTTVPITYTIASPGVLVNSSNVNQGIPRAGFVEQTSTLDTGIFAADFTTGSRFEFGRVNDGRGWMVSTFNMGTQTQILNTTNAAINFENGPVGFVDIRAGVTGTAGLTDPAFRGDGFDDDLDRDGVYGRNGRDRGTRNGTVLSPPLDGIPDPENPGAPSVPVDYDDAVALPTVFQSLSVQNRVKSWNVEVSRLWQLGMGPRGGIWELFVGPRFLNVNDAFSIDGRGSEFNPDYYQTSVADMYSRTNADNNLFGGQFGSRWSMQRERWQVSIESRFLAAANFQNINLQGQFATRTMEVALPPGSTTTTNTNPLRDDIINAQTPSSFQQSSNDVTFAPTGEIRANLKYQVFRSVYLQLGYNALYSYGVARAAQTTHYSFPAMRIAGENKSGDFFMNGVNLGVVINR